MHRVRLPHVLPTILGLLTASSLAWSADPADLALRVFAWPDESPRPLLPGRASSAEAGNQPAEVTRSLVTLRSLDATASPAGWISVGTSILSGNNANVFLDADGDGLPDAGRPTGVGSPLTFDFPLDLSLEPGGADYRNAAVTNAFYWVNWTHDRLYQLGFDEAAGNFQQDNFGRGGLGGDALQVGVQEGDIPGNILFEVAPDGQAGRLWLSLFPAPTPDRDAAFDATMIIRAYAQGMVNRLTCGGVPTNFAALQSLGLNEGWADFYAMALLSQAADDVDGNYAVGAYLSQNAYRGLHDYPYTTDLGRDPLKFADIAGIPYDHFRKGAVWGSMLWDMRCELVKRRGFAVGNELALRLVTEGLKRTSATPTFAEARDAILQADIATNAGANLGAIWSAFARRGLGVDAVVPGYRSTIGASNGFAVPPDMLVVVGGQQGASRLELVGDPGGPFLPSVPAVSLRNIGSVAMPWTATVNVPWLTLSAASGSLAAGAGSDVTLAPNAQANALAPGYYTANLTLTNAGSGSGSTVITVGLAVCGPYTISTPAYAWVDASSHVVVDFSSSAAQTLPFTFRFYGQDITQVNVGPNGFIGLGTDSLYAAVNSDLPSISTPNGIICPFWDNLNPGWPGGRVTFGSSGSAPNRQVVITYTAVPHYELSPLDADSQGYTFQALLQEGTNEITFQYQEVRPDLATYGAGRSATIGLEQRSGLRAARYSFNGSTLLTNHSAVRFSPDGSGGGSPVPGDLNASGSVNFEDLALFLSSYGKGAGDAGYLPGADLVPGGTSANKVDFDDLATFLSLYHP